MKFILLTHSQELLKKNNTGRVAQDILTKDVEVITWQRKEANQVLLALLASKRAALLYPEDDIERGANDNGSAERISPQVVNVVTPNTADTYDYYVILDATWQQAHKMYKQSPYLQDADKVAIRAEKKSNYQRRRNQREGGLCTVECIIELLALKGVSTKLLQLKEAYSIFNRLQT